jgi:GAF domain-containing protein
MEANKKRERYNRIKKQLEPLFKPVQNPLSRMATAASLLHHKFPCFFWTGFYLLQNDELLVGPYQGSLACMKLQKDTGVCWKGINTAEPVIVGNVHEFPGHIACDSRSNSEIVIPLFDEENKITGVLDVDSKEYNSFDIADAEGLSAIVKMIYGF